MTMLGILLVVVLVLVAVLVIALVVPSRIASRTSTHPHSSLDDESEAFREHPPGGGTGGI